MCLERKRDLEEPCSKLPVVAYSANTTGLSIGQLFMYWCMAGISSDDLFATGVTFIDLLTVPHSAVPQNTVCEQQCTCSLRGGLTTVGGSPGSLAQAYEVVVVIGFIANTVTSGLQVHVMRM